MLYQVDVPSQTISDDFPLTIGYWAGSLSVNSDGNRAFFGGDNSGHIIDFSDDTHEIFATNTAFSSATTSDRQYIYSSNFKASVLDFENKSIVGIHQGNTQGTCCVSPVGYKAFAYNNLFWEGGFFYDFSSQSSLDYVGWAFFGNPPEGDVPSRVAITPDGSKAVVTNPGSWTVSIVDLNANTVSSVLDVEESSRFVVVTNDGNWAIASGYDMNAIKVIDLNTEEIVAFVTTNQRPGNMIVSPDDAYVYVANIKGNSISKVLLDGANSIEVADFPCGTIGGVYSAYGIYTNMAITPDGAYLVVPISFENHVKIIDAETMTSVATIPTGNMPLQVAMNGAGDYATVTNISDDTYSVIHIDGANSSLVATHSNGLGNPIRVKYNPVLDQMTIVDYQHVNFQWKVLHTDPTTGDLITTEIHDGFGATLDVGYHETGTPVILTGAQPLPSGDYGDSHVLMGDLAYAIAPGPIAFDVNPATNTAVVACGGGGPDYISIVSLGDPLYPAVGTDPSQFVFEVDSGETAAELMILSNSGEGTLNFSIEVLYPGKDLQEDDWLSINPTSGNLEPGEEQNILVTADSDGLQPDAYSGVIAITSNDPLNPVWEVPVEFIVSTVVGISKVHASDVRIVPNPFIGEIMLETQEPMKGVRVIDMNGEILYDRAVDSNHHTIHFDKGQSGMYLLEINYHDGRCHYEKIIRRKL
jgi:YVTN family beta-propeller protein